MTVESKLTYNQVFVIENKRNKFFISLISLSVFQRIVVEYGHKGLTAKIEY